MLCVSDEGRGCTSLARRMAVLPPQKSSGISALDDATNNNT